MNVSLVSVVLPVHNQADHIGCVVDEYRSALAGMEAEYEILLVVNGCRDQSAGVCELLADQDCHIRTFLLAEPGWGRAVRFGIGHSRGDLICYTNSARTSAKNLVLLMLYATIYPETVVKGARKIRESFVRRLGSLLYNLECRALFDLATWDINGTPKVFPRRFGKLLELQQDGDLVDLEFNVICRRERYPVVDIPIFSSRRQGGKSTTSFRSAYRMYLGAYRLMRQTGSIPP